MSRLETSALMLSPSFVCLIAGIVCLLCERYLTCAILAMLGIALSAGAVIDLIRNERADS